MHCESRLAVLTSACVCACVCFVVAGLYIGRGEEVDVCTSFRKDWFEAGKKAGKNKTKKKGKKVKDDVR